MPKPTKEWNLQKINPTLAKQWHPLKNGNLMLKHVAPNMNRKVWWICNEGHEWYARVDNRNSGKGCPICSLRKIRYDSSLKKVNPKLAFGVGPR
jgi:hypothetical protein